MTGVQTCALPIFLVPAYFLGTFPSAVWIARTKGIDITKEGSGNPGASNIARTLGTKWGLLVFLLDALKGALPAALGLITNHRGLGYAMVAASVVGHMFPATRQFRGGKGVATMGGSALVLQPIVSIILLAVWFGVRKDRKSTRLNSSHIPLSRMPSSA